MTRIRARHDTYWLFRLAIVAFVLIVIPLGTRRNKGDSWSCGPCGSRKHVSYVRFGPSTTTFVDLLPPSADIRESLASRGLLGPGHVHTWTFSQGRDWAFVGGGGYI